MLGRTACGVVSIGLPSSIVNSAMIRLRQASLPLASVLTLHFVIWSLTLLASIPGPEMASNASTCPDGLNVIRLMTIPLILAARAIGGYISVSVGALPVIEHQRVAATQGEQMRSIASATVGTSMADTIADHLINSGLQPEGRNLAR